MKLFWLRSNPSKNTGKLANCRAIVAKGLQIFRKKNTKTPMGPALRRGWGSDNPGHERFR